MQLVRRGEGAPRSGRRAGRRQVATRRDAQRVRGARRAHGRERLARPLSEHAPLVERTPERRASGKGVGKRIFHVAFSGYFHERVSLWCSATLVAWDPRRATLQPS